MGATEQDVRNATTPPLDYDDISSAEITLKIRLVESYVKRKYFEGASIPSDGNDAIILIVLSHLLARSDLARKYGTLNSETLGDYSYEIGGGITGTKTSPLNLVSMYREWAEGILFDLSAEKRFQVRITNE